MNDRSIYRWKSIIPGVLLLLLLLVLALVLAGCGGPQVVSEGEAEGTAEPEPLPETPENVSLEASDAIEAPTAEEAVVVFLSGEVTVVTGGAAQELLIGETIAEGAIVQVGESGYCEIQLGDRALLRLEEDTQFAFERLALSENQFQATGRVGEGTVLARVERLTGRDGFNIRTDTAVAGVRGTRFIVSVNPEGESVVAVEEGRVSLLPPDVNIDVLREQYGDSADILTDLAPVVESTQQVTIPRDRLGQIGSQLAQQLQNATGEEIGRIFESAGAEIAQEVPPADRINPERERELRDFGQEQLRSLRTESRPTLVPLSITAEPREARITVTTPSGRQLTSRGSFSGIFAPGERLSATVRADGYETRQLDIAMQEGRGFSATVTLPEGEGSQSSDEESQETQEADSDQPEGTTGRNEATSASAVRDVEVDLTVPEDLDLPQPVFLTVLTRPGNARILRDGNLIGEGSAFLETEVGRRVTVRAELEGYRSAERTVSVTAETEPVIEIPLEREIVTEEITVTTQPSSARIFLGGDRVGQGRFSRTFETGQQLSFTARQEGYFEASRTITVRPGSTGTYTLRLEEEPRIKELTFVAEPRSTRIEINGEFAGRGNHTARYEWGSQLTVELSAPGYIATSERVTVRQDGPSRFEFALEEEPQFATLSLEVIPGDAELFLNGNSLGEGEKIREFEIGTAVTVSARRAGFSSLEEEIEISEDRQVVLRLEAEPVERTVDYAGGAVVRGFAPTEDGVVFADREGRIYRYTLDGDELWSYESENRPNENSIALVGGGVVYFTGAAEAVVLDLESGELLRRESLPEEASHLFGRSVTILEDGSVLFPDNNGIAILSPSGERVGRIDLPDGARSSVAVDEAGMAVVVDQSGTFHRIDLDARELLSSISTGLVQPVAARPALVSSVAVAVDRRGNGAGVDFATGEVLWETSVSETGLFSDPLAIGGTIYFTAGQALYGVAARTGEQRFSPLASVTTPPAYREGSLYVGRNDQLLEVNSRSGAIVRRLAVGTAVTGRPQFLGERVVLGSESGALVVVNRTGWLSASAPSPSGD